VYIRFQSWYSDGANLPILVEIVVKSYKGFGQRKPQRLNGNLLRLLWLYLFTKHDCTILKEARVARVVQGGAADETQSPASKFYRLCVPAQVDTPYFN